MGSYDPMSDDQIPCNSFDLLSWFDVKVFYVRISNVVVDDSAPEFLTLNHIPLDHETLLEINGTRCSIVSDGISSLLRRDRVDKKSEEVTFVSTDIVRFTGSVKFEVFSGENLVFSGIIERSSGKDAEKNWNLRCESKLIAHAGFLKAQQLQFARPVIEVYAAGWFSGAPTVVTETLQLSSYKKKSRSTLNAVSEHETAETRKYGDSLNACSLKKDLELMEDKNYKAEDGEELGFYWGREYMGEEDGEESWFNAGVRVGVGIGLGACLGLGLGVGLLLRTYQTTKRTFRRRLL